MADAVFERGEGLARLVGSDVQAFEIARAGGGYQSRAPHDGAVTAYASPQIRKIYGVERFAIAEPDGCEILPGHRRSEHGEGEARGGLGLSISGEVEGAR